MATTVLSILQEAQDQLNDSAGTRWPATELARHLNDGQRETCNLRPDAFATSGEITLVAGIKQTIPGACVKFMGVTRNTSGLPITKVDKALLEASDPTWTTRAQTGVIKHYCYDPMYATAFDVYPPALVGTKVDGVWAAMPADVATPSGAAYTTATGNITAPDEFKNALLNFVLYRAFSKDAEYGGNALLSAAHFSLFKSGLGDDYSTKAVVQPKTVT